MPPPITPIGWTNIQAAIHAFVVAATGLPAERVMWGNQTAPRPTYPYATITKISGPNPIGQAEQRSTTTGVAPADTTTLDIGANAEIVVSIKVHSLSATPAENAAAYIGAVFAALDIPTYVDPLRVQCAVRGINGPVNLPDMQVADVWISRAVLDVRLGIVSNVSIPIDVIETVQAAAVGDGLGSLDPDAVIDEEFG